METLDMMKCDMRTLPQDVEYYVISESGALVNSTLPKADVYIDADQMQYLAQPETLLYIRENYGVYIGVMREKHFHIIPEAQRTTKMLLGVLT